MVEYGPVITPEDPRDQLLIQAPPIIEQEPSWFQSLIKDINSHSITTLPGVIEPGSPEYHYMTQLKIQASFDEADEDELVGGPSASDIVKGVGVGITTTGAGISLYSASSTPATGPVAAAGTLLGGAVAVIGGVTAFTGFALGWAGLDVDESEPYIPEVGVDALA